LLGAASDALKDDSDTLEDSAKPEDTSKPEDPPKKEQTLTLSAVAAIFIAMAPATPAASFGLPSEGDEAGPPPNLTAAPTAVATSDVPVNVPLKMSIDASETAPEKSGFGPQPALAFALRLVDIAQAPADTDVSSRLPIQSSSLLKSGLVVAGISSGSNRPLVFGVAPSVLDVSKAAPQANAPLNAPILSGSPPRPAPAVAPLLMDIPKAAAEADPSLKLPLSPSSSPKPALAVALPVVEVAKTPEAEAPLRFPRGAASISKSAPGAALSPAEAAGLSTEGDTPVNSGPSPKAERLSAMPEAAAPESLPVAISRSERNGTIQQIHQPAAIAATDNPEPNPHQPRAERRNDELAELAPLRHSGAEPFTETTAPKQAVELNQNPAPAIAISSAATGRGPNDSGRIAAPTPPEPFTPSTPQLRESPRSEVTDVSLTVPGARSDSGAEERIAIRMVQRGGEIHVAVRTPDQQAAQSMRQDLSRLASSLDDAGFRADTWRPAATNVAGPSSTHGQREFSQEPRQGGASGSGAQSGKQDGRRPGEQKQRQQDERPRWVAELEKHRN